MTEIEARFNELFVDALNVILKVESTALQNGPLYMLSLNELHTLDAIGMSEGRSMGEVAGKLLITMATLTTAVNRLVEKGFVERRRESSDRRVVYISLTGLGRRAYRIHMLYHQKLTRGALANMSEEQQAALITVLENLQNFFAKELAEGAQNGISHRRDRQLLARDDIHK